jgi:hypothetical protein
VNERPAAHGASGIGTDWRAALAFAVSGVFRSSQDDPEAAHMDAVSAMTFIGSVLGKNRPAKVVVDDGGIATSRVASVRNVKIEDTRGGGVVQFTADLVAPDPRRYGQPVDYPGVGAKTSGGGLTFPLGTNPTAYWDFGADGTTNRLAVTNLGTAESFPLLKVSGGVSSGFVVTDVTTGAVVQFSRLIPVGSQVTVNQRTGRASIDGQSDVSANITIRQFFSIPPGQTHILQFTPLGPSGGPKLFVTLAPAF